MIALFLKIVYMKFCNHSLFFSCCSVNWIACPGWIKMQIAYYINLKSIFSFWSWNTGETCMWWGVICVHTVYMNFHKPFLACWSPRYLTHKQYLHLHHFDSATFKTRTKRKDQKKSINWPHMSSLLSLTLFKRSKHILITFIWFSPL